MNRSQPYSGIPPKGETYRVFIFLLRIMSGLVNKQRILFLSSLDSYFSIEVTCNMFLKVFSIDESSTAVRT